MSKVNRGRQARGHGRCSPSTLLPSTLAPVGSAPHRDSALTDFKVIDLAALEAIRRVKYRYLRCVDLKRWDEMAEVFTPGATADYGSPATGHGRCGCKPAGTRSSRSCASSARPGMVITLHAAGQPEIEIEGDAATGTWRFEDTVIVTDFRLVIKGAAFYEDKYVRGGDGKWRISHTGYVRIYETMQSLDDLPSPQVHRQPLGPVAAAEELTGRGPTS